MVTAPDGSEVRRVQFSHLSLADGRRALKGITVTSGNDTLDRHDFIYKNFGGNQPGDFFGFCNGTGSTGSKSVIDPNTGRFNSTRRYNPRTAAHGAMARHTTLTGARTDFEYEPNTLLLPRLNDSVQIGVRIKSITTTDMVCGRTQTRRYFYARPVCSIDFTQVDITPFVSLSGMSWLKTNEGRPTTTECHNVSAATLRSSRLPGAPLSSARIYYGEAAEEITGTGLEKPVRTEYEYDTSRCQLKRVGGGGNVNNSNPYFIRGDMTIPTTRTDPSVKRLFATGFADHYFAECNYAEPRLRVRRQMQWVNGAYHPLEEKEYFHSLVDSAAYRTGLHVEPLVKDVRNVYGSVKTAYKNTGDLVYFQTALLSGRWRLDSVAERRWHGTGPDAVVAHSGTRYRYTRRRTPVTGECVPWAQPASTVIPLPDMNPGGLTITGIGGDKVFGDSVSMTCDHEMLVGTVTTAAGHKAEHHTAWSACVPGRTYAVKTLPVAEMWIVDGRDSLLKRYEYGKFRSLTRPTRISLGLKGRPAMAEQRCTAYSPHGLPLDCHRTGQPEERYEYDGDMVTKISTGPSGSQLVSAFTHVPLVGCSSLTTPWGYTERFGYSGSRLTSRRGGTANRILERWAYRHRRGPGSVNAIEHTSYAAGEAAVTTECFDGLGASVGEVLNGYGADGDVLTATRMDALGRATRIWSAVPVTDAETALCDDDDLASAAQTFHGDSCAFTTLSYPLSGETSPIATTLPGSGFAGHPSTVERVCSDPSRPELRVRRLTWDGTTLRASGHYRAGAATPGAFWPPG